MHQSQMLGAAGSGHLEGVANDALNTVGGIDGDLGGDLVGSAHAHSTAIAAVQALSALAHNHEVDVSGVPQGGGHARVVLGGTQVHIVVQGEAQAQQ